MSIIKTVEEIRRKLNIRLDADEEEKPKPKKHSALSTRLPYALCKESGINTEGMTPREAWEAYEGKTGKSAESAKSEKMGEKKGATSFLGKGNKVPTKDDIMSGNATYGGIPIKYDPKATNDASNWTSEIHVSPKFFEHDEKTQQHILNHEVAHNLSDEMMGEHSGDWNEFASNFIQEKDVPESSSAYKNGQRKYWEGLYGDIGATALSETTTRAITEYLDDPEKLKARSEKAYDAVKGFVDRKMVGGDTKSSDTEDADTSKYTSAFKDAVKGHSSFEIKDAVRKSLDEMPTGYTAVSHDRAYKKIGDDQFEYETSSGEKKVATAKQILRAHGRSDLEGDFDVKDDKYVHQKKQVKSDLNEKLRPSRDDYEYEDGDGVDEFTHKNVGKLMPLYEEGGSDAIDSEYYKFKLGRVTKDLHEISRDEADEILFDNLSQSTVDGWFRAYNHEYKDNLTKQMIQSPEVHNAALNIMYGNYKYDCEAKKKEPLSFDEFLVTPIKMYRGGTGKEYDKASVFSSYTFDKGVAGSFTGSEVGMGHAPDPNGVIYEAEIRPIDTYGSVFTNGEAEILVPREIAPNGRRDEADVLG